MLEAVSTAIGENLARDAGRVERLNALEASEWNRAVAYLEKAVPAVAADEDVFNSALARIARTMLGTVRPSHAADPRKQDAVMQGPAHFFVSRLDDWLCCEAIGALTVAELRLSDKGSEEILRKRGTSLVAALLEAIADLPDRQRVSIALGMWREDQNELVRSSLEEHAARLALQGAIESVETLFPVPPVRSDHDVADYLAAELGGEPKARHVAANRSAAREKLLENNAAWAPLLNTLLPYRSSKAPRGPAGGTDPELATILETGNGRGSLRLFEIAVEEDCPRFMPVLPLSVRSRLGVEGEDVGSWANSVAAVDSGFEQHRRACTRCRLTSERLERVLARPAARAGAVTQELSNDEQLDPRVEAALVGLLDGEERTAIKTHALDGLAAQLRLTGDTILALRLHAGKQGKLKRHAEAVLDRQAKLHAELREVGESGAGPEEHGADPVIIPVEVLPGGPEGDYAQLSGPHRVKGRVFDNGEVRIELSGLPERFEGKAPELVLAVYADPTAGATGSGAPGYLVPDRAVEAGVWQGGLGPREPWMERFLEGGFEVSLKELSDREKLEITRRLAGSKRGARSHRDLIGALATLRQQLMVVRRAGSTRHEAALRSRIGSLHYELGQFDQARHDHKQALELALKSGDREVQSAALKGIGESLHAQGDTRGALDLLEQSLAVARKIGPPAREASTLVRVAHAALDAGELDQASKAAKTARDIFRDAGDDVGLAAALNISALCHRARADYDKALEMTVEAIELVPDDTAKSSKDERETVRRKELRLLAELHCTTGRVYLALGEYNRAQASFSESLALAYRVGYRRGEADAIHVMGRVYHAVGLWEHAESSYRRALAIAELLGDRRRERVAWGTLARLHRDRSENLPPEERKRGLEEGLKCVERALEYATELDDKRGQAMALTTRSRLRRELSNDAAAHAAARDDLVLASELRRESRDLRGSAHTLIELADLEGDAGSIDRAITLLKQAEAVNKRAVDPRAEITIHEKLGERLEESGSRSGKAAELVESLERYVKAVESVEALRRNVADAYLRDRFFERYSRCYRAYATRARKTNPKRAFAVADAARARNLLDFLEANGGDDPARLPLAYQMMSEEAMDAARASLPVDALLLFYLIDEQQAILFAVDRSGVRPLDLEIEPVELERAIRDLNAAVEAGQPTARLAHTLYRDLVAPAGDLLEGKRDLLISPDGCLHDLPFALLRTGEPASGGDRAAPLLIRRHALTTTPSLAVLNAVLARARKREERWSHDLLLVGAPAPDGSVAEADLHDEAARIVDVFARELPGAPWPSETDAEGIRLLVGAVATKRAVMSARRVVRCAHVDAESDEGVAGVGDAHPGYPRMHLAAGDRWHHDEILEFGFVSRVVTTIAPGAASGAEHSVEGRLSLARTFLMGGSESVCAPMTRVDRQPAGDLICRFYRELLEGVPASEALRLAQVALAEAGSAARDWATFRLVGSPSVHAHSEAEVPDES